MITLELFDEFLFDKERKALILEILLLIVHFLIFFEKRRKFPLKNFVEIY